MSENIQDENDELFRNAYNSFGEDPGPEVWEKLNAQLDKKDAIYYRAKTALWKRSAYALLILLACFVSYEFLFKTERKSQSETNTNASSKQPTFDSLEGNRTKQIAQKAVEDSLQAVQKTKPSLLSQSNTTQKPNHHSTVLQATESRMKEKNTTRKQLITAEKRTHIAQIQTQTTVVKSAQATQSPELLKDQFSGAEKKNIAEAETNHSIAKRDVSSHNKNDSLPEQNTVVPQNKTSDNTANKITVDSSSRFIKPNDNATASNENKLDSGTIANHSTAKKTSITINHLFKPHWSFSPYASLDFSGQHLDDNDHHPEPGNRDARHEIQNRENEQVSYSLGVLARYQLSKKITLKTGLVYINSSVKINPQTLYAAANGQDVNYKLISSSGYAYIKPSFDPSPNPGDSIRTEVASNKLSYLSIPFMAGYTISAGKKLTIIPGIGFSANLLLHSKISTEVHGHDENEKSSIVINKIQGLDRLNFSLLTDAEVHYKIASKWNLLLLPSFKYAINPITKEHVVKTYPYNFSVGLGVTYGF